MTTKKRGKSPPPPEKPSLEEYADEHVKAVYAENAEIARANRVLRSTLAEKQKTLDELQKRIAKYEHPGVFSVERLLARQATLTRDDIAQALEITVEDTDAILHDMAARGYNIQDGVLSREGATPRVTINHFFGPDVRFGVVSDTHIGNMHELVEQLHEAYEVFQREGIERVYACGNLLDGEKAYRGQEYEIYVMGADNAVANLANKWPKIPSITTSHIASSTCHEGYYYKTAGLLIGKMIENERPDMEYLGQDEADIGIYESEARPILRLIHPGGGASYAQSYRPQKIVESYSGAEKPTVLLIGHYHKAGFYDIRNVAVFQVGCLETQTTFMRKNALEAHLGFWIVELQFTEHGSLRRVKQQWFKYYMGVAGKVLRDWNI